MEKRLLNIDELAVYINVKKNTLYCWVSQRRVPFVKVGHLTKFDKKAIDRWLEENSVKENNIDLKQNIW